MSHEANLSNPSGIQPFRFLPLLLGAIIATVGAAHAKPRAGSAEAELLLQEEAHDRVSMTLARKKEELEMYRQYQETAAEIQKARQVLATEKEKLAALDEEKLEVEDAVSALQLSFEDYRDQYRKSEREAAKGEILDLSETKGAGYEESKVLGISPLHLRVSRPTGAEGIPFKDLPESIQDRFQFSEEEAAAYQLRLAKTDAARAQQFAEWKAGAGKGGQDPLLSSANHGKRLEATMKLAAQKREESSRYESLSDQWRTTAARFWKGVSRARSASARKSRESTASKAESKADDFMDLSKSVRLQAIDLDGEVLKIRELIAKEAKEKKK